MKKKSYILPMILALCAAALPAVSQNLQNQQEQMRFQGLDRNRDGMITRNEWRGNNKSFANEDWNGDGVLSGDEVRPGARRTGDLLSSERTTVQFRDMDRNNDGLLGRDEWRGDRMAFDRMDTSRDGLLTRDEYFLGNDDHARRFADLDRNHDGHIARNEWNDDRQAFDALDANRDNLLGLDEYSAFPANVRVTNFADLDANRDGRITRNEWLGDRRTFEGLDTNRDAVLTRNEFSAQATSDRSISFLDLDANRDGRIARNEWRGDYRDFDNQDYNRDGFVSRDEFQRVGNRGSINNSRGYPMTISSGSEFVVRSNETIDSKTAAVGQLFSALIEKDILDNTGKLAIPKGSDATLVIRQTDDGGMTNASELVLDVDSVTVSGIRYVVFTADIEEKGREGIGANRRTGVMVGGGAGIGALIGAITGGKKGAAIGAGVGAAAGAAGQILTKGGEVRVPAETVLNFKLEQDLHLEPAR